jgi:hypothetical protein
VTWFGSDGNDEEIYWVKIDSAGTPGTVKKISTHPEGVSYDDQYPQIAVDSSGNSYVTWYGYDGNIYNIYWVKIDSSETLGTIQKISTHPEGVSYADWNPQIAVDSSGNSYVAWQGHDGNDKEVYWVKIDARGVPGTVQKISNHPDNVHYNDSDPQIAVDILGNSYIIWHGCDEENCDEGPGDLEIYWVKVDSSGTRGTVQKIPPTSPENVNTMAMIPQLTVDASGNSYIVWSGMNEESYDIYWAKINASGNERTIQKISTYLFSTVYDDRLPQIAADSSGNSYITWESFNRKPAEQFDQTICWVKVDFEGNPGKVHNISSCQERKHFDQNPRIAVSARGNSYITWRGQDTSKIDHIFFTAHFPNEALPSAIMVVTAIVIAITAAAVVTIIRRKIRRISTQ